MIVLIEGGDGSGKTTLCKQLNDIGINVLSVERYNKNAFNIWCRYVTEYRDSVAVCDRSFITDLVYRLQDDEQPDYMNLRGMCGLLANMKIIHCETDTSFEDGITRGETNITNKKQAEYIKELYNIIIKMFNKFESVPVLRYNWHVQDVNDVMDFILDRRSK